MADNNRIGKKNKSNLRISFNTTYTNQRFVITIPQLQDLMREQGTKGVNKLEEVFGGINKLCSDLYTSPETGIKGTSQEIQLRRHIYGINFIEPPKSKTFCQLVLIALNDPILIFLVIGGLFSIFAALFEKYFSESKEDTYEWIEGIAIIISVLIIVLVTATTDCKKEQQFRKLQEELKLEHKIPVIRDNEIIELPIKELVVGDICLIKYGNSIPADGVVIQSNDLKIDESALTGESDLVVKGNNIDILLLSGTNVMEGSGKMLITAVGVYSQNGIILSLLGLNTVASITDNEEEAQKLRKVSRTIAKLKDNKSKISNIALNKEMQGQLDTTNKSILQIKLLKLAFNISKCAIVIAVVLVIILLSEFTYFYITEDKKWNTECIHIIIEYILTGISILVIAIPEGLPLAVTLSLAYSVRQMTYDNNLVRNLAACETMGNATTICSDKTGTLTTNRMTCVELYTCEKLYKKIPNMKRLNAKCCELIMEGISVNSLYTSLIVLTTFTKQQIGNKTECALLGLVIDLGGDYNTIRSNYPEDDFIYIYTFNSVRKSMSTVIKINDTDYRIYTKGASEIIMAKCRYIFNINGQIEEFTNEMKTNMNNKIIIPMANNGLRTITIAYRDFLSPPSEPLWIDEDNIINDLVLLCVCGIEDPVRPEVPNAIRLCQKAGITVRMVTGDNIQTAKSIALKCGIIQDDNSFLIMEGDDFNDAVRDYSGKVDQRRMDRIWPRLRVLARSKPMDKYILVKGIIDSKITRHREVVAVTGDGTNDGPALKIADVGFAMGVTGTDVAKEASDIIITDDNFISIIKAVMWGRNIYDSIAKFIQFQLTVNLVAVIIAVLTAILTNRSVLKAVQLLWVNLIMDSLASLALATEQPTEKILNRKPYGRTRSIISTQMCINIILQAIYQLIVLAVIFFTFDSFLNIPNGNSTTEPTKHYTIVFNTLVMMTLFNEINSRKLHGEINILEGLLSNRIFLIIWFITLVGQIIIIQYGSYVFHTKALNLIEWFWCILFGVGTIIWSLLYNRIPLAKYVKNVLFPWFKKDSSDDDIIRQKSSDEIVKPWVTSSRRLTRQINVINRLSQKVEDSRMDI